MRRMLLILLLLTGATAFAVDLCGAQGTGSDKPTNCQITWNTSPPSATFTWNTVNLSDSMVMTCEAACGSAFSPFRQNYDATLTRTHSVNVPYLQPNSFVYWWSVASCTAGPNCPSGSRSWSTAPFNGISSGQASYVTGPTAHPAGTLSWFAEMQGPQNAWQDPTGYASIAVGINNVVLDGTWPSNNGVYTTVVTVDGQSCLPAILGTSSTLGSACGTTGILFQFVCNGNEPNSPSTNNYNLRTGAGSFPNTYRCGNVPQEPSFVALMYGNGPTAIGAHTLSITMQATIGTTQVPLGSPVVAGWTFNINAYPAFTPIAPSSFPAIPSYGTWLARIATKGTYEVSQFANAFSQGAFCNDNYSPTQTAYDPCSTFNYDGNMIYKYLGDQAASVNATWASGHSYNVGDQILDTNGCVETVEEGFAGTSRGTQPTWPACPASAGQVTHDGSTLRWVGGGSKDYWNQASEVIGMPYLDWTNIVGYKGLTGGGGIDNESNIFPFGPVMDFYRQNDTYTGNCNSGGGCAGLAAGAINYFAGVNRANYVNTNIVPFVYWGVAVGTIRTLPYNFEAMLAQCEITNNAGGCMNNPEMTRRRNLLLNTIDASVTYSPRDGVVSTYACCIDAPVFDYGLVSAALVYDYDLQSYLGLTPDNRIPVQLMRLNDWLVAKFYNLTGSDYTFPYGPWTVGNNTRVGNYLSSQQLDNLSAPWMAWLWAMNGGDTCTFPTSGLGCRAVADQLFTTTLNAMPFSGKSFNEEYEWLNNFTGWRTGVALDGVTSFPAADHYVLPNHNSLGGAYVDVVGPFNGQTFPCLPISGCPSGWPSVSAITSNTALATWYTFEQIDNTQQVKLGSTATTPTSTFNCSPVSSTFAGGGTLNLWVNTCLVTGLSPSTTYYFAVCGTDVVSNSACSQFSTAFPSAFSFTTAAGS
jgi:hypothetical protein